MQIVINIPEGAYGRLQTNSIQNGSISSKNILNAVKAGTPLPEHHGDLKDVDKIKEEAIDMSQWGSDTAYGVWVEDIDATPTIIPATKEKSCKTCAHKNDDFDCHNFCVPYDFDHYILATKEGE